MLVTGLCFQEDEHTNKKLRISLLLFSVSVFCITKILLLLCFCTLTQTSHRFLCQNKTHQSPVPQHTKHICILKRRFVQENTACVCIKWAAASCSCVSQRQEWEVGDVTAVFIDPLLRMSQSAPTISTTPCRKIQLSSTNQMLSVNIDGVYGHSSRSENNTSQFQTLWGTNTVLHAPRS